MSIVLHCYASVHTGQNDPSSLQTDSSSESEADVVTDGCGSPRMQRRRRQKVFRAEKVERSITFRTLDELLYNDNLPEVISFVFQFVCF